MENILIIGSAHTVIGSRARSMAEEKENIAFEETGQSAGGSGYKASLFVAKMGFPYLAAFAFGNGVYADFMRKAAEENNIHVLGESEETAGCSYDLSDDTGGSGRFIVSGGEYAFSPSYLKTVNPEEIAAVIVFSDMLADRDAMEIYNVIEQIDAPIFLVISERGGEIDQRILLSMFALSPTVICEEEYASSLIEADCKSLDETAAEIVRYTFSRVMICTKKNGVYYHDGEVQFRCEAHDEYDADLFAAAFVLAKTAGLDERNSCYFALETAETYTGEDDLFFAERRKTLAKRISAK